MKKKMFLFLVPVFVLASCSLEFSFGSNDNLIDIEGDGSVNKQNLVYDYNDFVKQNLYIKSAIPNNGNPKLLIVPIWLTDSSSYYNESAQTEMKENIYKAFFGSNEETGWRSVKTYYEELSHNAVSLTGEVTDFYSVNYSTTTTTNTDITKNIATKAANDYKTFHSDEYASFDSDNDGFLDAVILIYAAPNYRSSLYSTNSVQSQNSTLWAFTHWVQNKNYTSSPIANAYMWASYDFLSRGLSLHNPMILDTHTYIHETGHLFGLEDYYDYSSSENYAGGFSMQDLNVGSHDPYSAMALGWVKPYVPTKSCEMTISDFQSSGDLIMLTPQYSGSPFDEYLLLELYSPTGLNELDSSYRYCGNNSSYPYATNQIGIRLWHVDARLLQYDAKANLNSLSSYSTYTSIYSSKYYTHANTNTTYINNSDSNSYCSDVEEYRSNRLLELVRKDDKNGTQKDETLENNDLFIRNDSFNISSYTGYFNSSKLNNNKAFNYSFEVTAIDSVNKKASISITLEVEA